MLTRGPLKDPNCFSKRSRSPERRESSAKRRASLWKTRELAGELERVARLLRLDQDKRSVEGRRRVLIDPGRSELAGGGVVRPWRKTGFSPTPSSTMGDNLQMADSTADLASPGFLDSSTASL